jgi:hypothetical protein
MSGKILAVVTTKKEMVGGGAPIFVTGKEQLQRTAFILEKVLDAMVHELNEDTMIIVRH